MGDGLPLLVCTTPTGLVHILRAPQLTQVVLDEIAEAFIADVMYTPMQDALRSTFGRWRYQRYAINRAVDDGRAIITFSQRPDPAVLTHRGEVVAISDLDRGGLVLHARLQVPTDLSLPSHNLSRRYRAGNNNAP